MADKDEKTQPQKKQETPEYHYQYHKSIWLVPVIVVIVVFLAGLAGSIAVYNHRQEGVVLYPRYGRNTVVQRDHGMYGMRGVGMMDNSQNTVSGVVTNVTGSSFTVAGSGSTQKVSISNSTQYTGGNQVKTNDTVVIYGTTNNGVLAATQVIINP